MRGKGNVFDSNMKMQREEIAQSIYNMAGKPEISTDSVNPFSDVKETDWFYKSVIWCSKNEIVSGIENGRFGKGQKITREDFTLMLYKFAILMENPSINNIDNSAIEGYADSDIVSSYAKTAMNWAVTNGLLIGKGKTGVPKSELRLDPKGYLTRAECATIITMFREPLFNKRVVGVGDSLMRGDKLSVSQTWLGLLGSEHGVVTFNYGENGNSVANVSSDSVTGMVGRIDRIYEEVPQADYFVLIGGANDKRLNVPIGEDDSTDIETFCGAINSIIDKVREYWPEAHIIFMTNYDRYKDKNSLDLGDLDYVEAMKRVCEKREIFCFDNYHDSGVDFQDTDFISWADEGIYFGGPPNAHFSPEGYRWLLPKYKFLLENN